MRQLDLLDAPPPPDRGAALERLEAIFHRDLRPLADVYGVTVWRDGRLNKGWAGQVVECYLGQSPNARQGADFGDWELKVVPLEPMPGEGDRWRLKETMAITRLDPDDVLSTGFEDSHLLAKLRRIVVVARTHEGDPNRSTRLVAAAAFDLNDPELYSEIEEDYEEVRWALRDGGAFTLSGHLGRWVQPRPKGPGRGDSGLGFYARKALVARMLGLEGG